MVAKQIKLWNIENVDYGMAEAEVMGGQGDMSSPTFGQGGHYRLSPQYFVIKNNVVVQISCLHYCWKPAA